MIGFLVFLWVTPMTWLSDATWWLSSGFRWVVGLTGDNAATIEFSAMISYVQKALTL